MAQSDKWSKALSHSVGTPPIFLPTHHSTECKQLITHVEQTIAKIITLSIENKKSHRNWKHNNIFMIYNASSI